MLEAAAAAGIALPPRRARVFDEVVDIVAADLVLVLDHFDLTEARPALLSMPPVLMQAYIMLHILHLQPAGTSVWMVQAGGRTCFPCT